MDVNYKFEACKKARKIATDALANTLKRALKSEKISEREFRNIWLKELRECSEIFSDGWYIPPPHGLIVLFATTRHPERVLYPNMRLEATWPRDDVYLDKTDGILAFYASPVDRKSGVIGDTEVMVYLGNEKSITRTLKSGIEIDREIFEFAHVGQKFSQLSKFANKLIESKGFTNNVLSTTDPQSLNIGHTIPVTYDDWTSDEKDLLETGENWEKICQMISKKRIFVNEAEDFEIKTLMAFTIEPRLKLKGQPELPSAWSHSIAFFDANGSKELILGFEEIYKICGMN